MVSKVSKCNCASKVASGINDANKSNNCIFFCSKSNTMAWILHGIIKSNACSNLNLHEDLCPHFSCEPIIMEGYFVVHSAFRLKTGYLERGQASRLVIDNVTYDYQGEYECRATNVINGQERTVASEPVSLQVVGECTFLSLSFCSL